MRDLPHGTVTLVFTDIEGSTRLLHELGDRYRDTLEQHRALLRAAFSSHGGIEVDAQGDAFFYAFARARDAVEAAARAQRALESHPWLEGHDVRVRMGIHSGEPQVTEEGYVGEHVISGPGSPLPLTAARYCCPMPRNGSCPHRSRQSVFGTSVSTVSRTLELNNTSISS
jgi:hypothetical protein